MELKVTRYVTVLTDYTMSMYKNENTHSLVTSLKTIAERWEMYMQRNLRKGVGRI